ncbi:translation initiation factor IF-2 subunit beta [Candidatus Micrarchaeota archaeon]|nr:translation initiation factor IF-2 subunit beta [Candidatus Micrarchaeota archaeon]MBU1165995.1 translation initiation factor IF-2 subunit beta [Candidatus Micrarchaeota archaeon]MBU1886785.1 translation initiation factor IF-2 subunit beta [Candidatus Micrarchaeota archaeon]
MSSDKNYEQLLDDVYSNLPKRAMSGERFEMPKFEYFTEGNKTIIKNFKAVAEKIRRDPQFISKYLSKELAVPVEIKTERLILQRRLTGDILNKKLEELVLKYVMCKECKRPDTHIEESGRIRNIICESCGARAAIR